MSLSGLAAAEPSYGYGVGIHQLNQVMESVVSQLSSKADHTTMVLMVTTLTMFMERDLLNQDISMELIQVNNMFQGPIPAMELMLPTPIKDC